MITKLLALVALLLLLATAVAAYSYINLKADATVVLDTNSPALLVLECHAHSIDNGNSNVQKPCNIVNGEMRLHFSQRGAMVEGQIAPQGRHYTWDDLVQLKNGGDHAVHIDIDVSEGWPSWAGICAIQSASDECAWFIGPVHGDTGYAHRLEPGSTMDLGFRFEVPQGTAFPGFPTQSTPVITVKATAVH